MKRKNMCYADKTLIIPKPIDFIKKIKKYFSTATIQDGIYGFCILNKYLGNFKPKIIRDSFNKEILHYVLP